MSREDRGCFVCEWLVFIMSRVLKWGRKGS